MTGKNEETEAAPDAGSGNGRVNGRVVALGGETVAGLVARIGVDPTARFLAVAVNRRVVRRADWPATTLAEGDEVEIVRPLQGG